MPELPIFPEQASTVAGRVDAVFYALLGLSGLFIGLIFASALYFIIKYRRGSGADRVSPVFADLRLELIWIVIPLFLGLGTFTWAANVYFDIRRPPEGAIEIYVVGKQWMWKVQHPEGLSEINELHVPLGRPVKLIMTSQDVIHSFFVPAFRIKMDVLPGRYTTTWFEATKPGEYHLFCAEYCGTQHSGMGGQVIVMEPDQYQAWLAGEITPERATPASPRSMGAMGEALFQELGCNSCHLADGSGVGPSLIGQFGQTVRLQSGETVSIDEEYVRQSVLEPNAQVVAGYEPVMPSFRDQVSEEELMQLIAYIKSLGN